MRKSIDLSERLSGSFEPNTERFKLYQKTVFGTKEDSDPSSVVAQVFTRNLRMTRYSASIVALTNVFWLVNDILHGGDMNLTSGISLASIIIQILFSIYMLLLPRFARNKASGLVRYSFFAYYVSLVLAVTVLSVTKNIKLLSEGAAPTLTGLPLSTCYLFIPIFAPLPSKRDSLALTGIFVLMMFLPLALPGRELYGVAQQVIVRLCMLVGYWYFRGVNIALARSIYRLSALSLTDPLTKVFNRRALDLYWEYLYGGKAKKSIGVMIFDIDDFKKYNDRYTHAKGDIVLSSVCGTAIVALGEDVSFLFRYGGEEFVILLPDQSDEELLEYGNRVRQAIWEAGIKRDDDSGFDRITVTVGCASEPVLAGACPDYITQADEQLYLGKKSGKNCTMLGGKVYR